MASKDDANQTIRRNRLAECQAKLKARTDKCYSESNKAIQAEIARLEQVIADVDAHVVVSSV